VNTVSQHERGAKVNWLWVGPRVHVMNDWSDQRIAETFERLRGTARVIRVRITEEAEQ
jgi:hypothetical protein